MYYLIELSDLIGFSNDLRRMGFIFCGKHTLLQHVTRIQVSDPCPLFFYIKLILHRGVDGSNCFSRGHYCWLGSIVIFQGEGMGRPVRSEQLDNYM